MKSILTHMRIYVVRGLLAIIPLGLSFFLLQFLYIVIDKRVGNFTEQFFGFRIYGLGFVFVIIILYGIGLIASNVIGKQFFRLIENITKRIPLIRSTYQIGKQLSETLSLPEKQLFKKVVLVDYFRPGVWAVGFVTGSMKDKISGEDLLKVFVPTVPNPTSGILIALKESQTVDPRWSVEEGMKMVISGGIIGPEFIG